MVKDIKQIKITIKQYKDIQNIKNEYESFSEGVDILIEFYKSKKLNTKEKRKKYKSMQKKKSIEIAINKFDTAREKRRLCYLRNS